MPRVILLGCLLVFRLSSSALAVEQGSYIEQRVTMDAVSGQPAMQGVQRIWFTSRHIRNQTSYGDQTSVAIIDLANERIVLMPSEEKQYLEMKLKDYRQIVRMRLSSTGLSDQGANPKLTNTKEQRKIEGWNCTKYLFEQGGKVPIKSELWISKDAGINFKAYLDLMDKLGMSQMLGRLSDSISSIDGYPIEVRIEWSHSGQSVVATTRVTKIAVGPVDPALFEIPKGYERLEGESLPEK